MLLKYSQFQKRTKLTASGKPQKTTGGSRVAGFKGGHHHHQRRAVKGKRLTAAHKTPQLGSKREEVESVAVCDNSNDSGLGFDHHADSSQSSGGASAFAEQEYWSGASVSGDSGRTVGGKKRRLEEIKLETEETNDDFTFPRLPRTTLVCNSNTSRPLSVSPPTVRAARPSPPVAAVGGGKARKGSAGAGLGAGAGGIAVSRDGTAELRILTQPEGQHRARYQTEGSRGAVKDVSGNGFPVVKLSGYERSATLEVYIGTDQGRVAPHMFYQACKVSGKNSTPCVERKLNGTVVIQIEFDPRKDMVVTCDCVGILKERNVDVEQRFPDEGGGGGTSGGAGAVRGGRKKSTRCRMVFRTTLTKHDGSVETLQVTSHPIVCTQPPGVPEICKKSLASCPSTGGAELFILGKNFLKDSRVVFSEGDPSSSPIEYWEASVTPDKDFLQQSHLVCVVPPYKTESITDSRTVRLWVVSGGRQSESQRFVFTPPGSQPSQAPVACRTDSTHGRPSLPGAHLQVIYQPLYI